MKFSVLMSVYFQERTYYLEQSLQSLADQTLKADEVILVEDGPIGAELKSVIEQFRSRLNILSVNLFKNSGLSVALNEGLKHCSYDFVARMDSDDISLPQRFEKQVSKLIMKPEVSIIGSLATEINENGARGTLRCMPITHEDIVANLWANPLIHPSVMFRTEKLLKLGGYDISVRRRQDYELWFRCAMAGLRFENIPEPLLLYRFNTKTHKKQPVSLALEQALIGYKGANQMGMALWKRVACFLPFFRSLLPSKLQHSVYIALRRLDPRYKKR
jgi:glycosyltransferase involved in cell wall biosynthesis